MQTPLHLLSSYLLILPSVSIRTDCCHYRPVGPCISFLFFSLLSAHGSLCLSQSISLLRQTDNCPYADTGTDWSGGAERRLSEYPNIIYWLEIGLKTQQYTRRWIPYRNTYINTYINTFNILIFFFYRRAFAFHWKCIINSAKIKQFDSATFTSTGSRCNCAVVVDLQC